MEKTVVKYTTETLAEIRRKLTVCYNENSDIFDEIDYKRVMEDDDFLSRYIRRRRENVDQGYDFLVEALKWRKKMGVPRFQATDFPTEFYEVGGIYPYSCDVNGYPVVHIRIRLFQKFSEIMEEMKKFTVYQMMRADAEAAAKGDDYGWVLLFDCTGAGVVNADLEMAMFVNNTLKSYFPSGQKYVLCYNLPWLLNTLKTVIFAMLPSTVKQRIKFCTDGDIKNYIPEENLPDYLGGSCKRPYRAPPANGLTTEAMVKSGAMKMNADQLVKVEKYYSKLLIIIKKEQEKLEEQKVIN